MKLDDIQPGRRRWTPEEMQKLRDLFPTHRDREVAAILGRTVSSVRSQACNWNIRKLRKEVTSNAKTSD